MGKNGGLVLNTRGYRIYAIGVGSSHSDRECPIWLKSKKDLKEEEKQFSPRLWAFAMNLSRKTVVRDSGCYEEDSEDED